MCGQARCPPVLRQHALEGTHGGKPQTQTVHRDAGSGQFVKKEYADKHPKTTVKETVKNK